MTDFSPPGLSSDPDIFKLLTEIDMIAHMAKREFERILPEGTSQAQFGVLNRLMRLNTTETVSELARAFQVTQPTMTSTLKKLEAKSLIRVAPDEKDRRAKRVSITELGQAERARILGLTTTALTGLHEVFKHLPYEILLTELGSIRAYLEERAMNPRAPG